MTNINDIQTTPDIWGVYPENALLRAENLALREEKSQLLQHIREDALHRQQVAAERVAHIQETLLVYENISDFIKWCSDNYDLDKQNDIWELLEGLFDKDLMRDPRRKTFRVVVQRVLSSTYEVDVPWNMEAETLNGAIREITHARAQDAGNAFDYLSEIGRVGGSEVHLRLLDSESSNNVYGENY